MLHIFWLVIQDLFEFVTGKPLTVLPFATNAPALPPRPTTITIAPPKAVLSLEAQVTADVKPKEEVTITLPLHSPTVMYVIDESASQLLVLPQSAFDGCFEIVPYGTAVTVVGYSGRYASILRAGHTGWILKDSITPDKSAVWPQFIVNHEYRATDTETIKVRSLLHDSFGVGILSLPLQATEYVTVRLMNDHRSISWPKIRPRLPGSWQQILRGVPGVHNSISPKTDTIMEWTAESGEGRLAYVESVTPDNAISLTLIGLTMAGQYTTLQLPESAWRELRPVFIEVL